MKNLEKAMESRMLILIVVIECSTLLEYIYIHVSACLTLFDSICATYRNPNVTHRV